MSKSQNVDATGDQSSAVNSSTSDEQLPEWIVECLSRLFSSISDPTRIRIVHALTDNDRLSVTELANHTDLSISAISHQLRPLPVARQPRRSVGLLQSRG